LAVEFSVEGWYRIHERRLPSGSFWSVNWPRDNSTYRELPLTSVTKRILRFDQGTDATWLDQGAAWRVIFLRWEPGSAAVHLAKNHTPAVCLSAAGLEMISRTGVRSYAVNGIQLPFLSYVMRDESGLVHIYYCLWEDRAAERLIGSSSLDYHSRLTPVIEGRRNCGQRSLEVAFRTAANGEDAENLFKRELMTLIKLDRTAAL
jgi:hypothetical protein